MISLEKITCVKQDAVIFSDLNLQIRSGQLLHIAGNNGSGKTSLLKILAGLTVPYSGSVRYFGNKISDLYYHNLLYLGHKNALHENLSVQDNLDFFLQLHSYNYLADLDLVINGFAMRSKLQELVCNLSSGQKQRASLLRLLPKNKTVWVLDEPFVSLDAAGISYLEQLIKRQLQYGCVVLTSHQHINKGLYDDYQKIEL